MDRDLSRAIKDEVGREMQGFEFSAVMKANVLKRIRAEQGGLVVPFERPTARRKLGVPRPLIWTAIAVAAFAMAFNLKNLSPMGAVNKGAQADASMGARGLSASQMAAPAGPSPEQALVPPADSAATASATGEANRSFQAAQEAQPRTRMIELLSVKAKEESARMPVPASAPPPSILPPVLNLSVAPVDWDLVMLTSAGVERRDAAGVQVWQHNPGGITPDSTMAVNAEGRSAVSAGNKVYLISQNGELERTLEAPGLVTSLDWSADGRVAVTAGATLTVYRGDQAERRIQVAPSTRTAFLPDGSLAVFAEAGNPKQVALYDKAGNRTFRVDFPEAGKGLAISNGGQTILAGGVALELSGRVLWQLQFPPEGVTTVPASELLLAWFGDTVAAVRPDGHEVWRARLEGAVMQRAAISDDGARVVVVATSGAETGATIFVLDTSGEQLLNERATSVPVDIALAGNKLFLLYGQGHQEFVLR